MTDPRTEIEKRYFKVPSPFEPVRVVEEEGKEKRELNQASPELGLLLTEEQGEANNELKEKSWTERENALWSEMGQLKQLVSALLSSWKKSPPSKPAISEETPGFRISLNNFNSTDSRRQHQQESYLSPRS